MKRILFIAILFSVALACKEQENEILDTSVEDIQAMTAEEKATFATELKTRKKEARDLIKENEDHVLRADSLLAIADPSSVAERVVLVHTDTVEMGAFQRLLEVQGAVAADNEVMLSPEVGGRLLQVNAKEGQRVRKGQLLARVNMESITKQKAELQTALTLATDIYEKQKRLWDQNIGSEIQFLEAKNNKERLEKSLETLDFEMTKANVYAPISGVVQELYLESGETVVPGAPILKILNDRSLVVKAALPEQLLPRVKRGDYVDVVIPALEYEKRHRVTFISSVIDNINRTFDIEVDIQNTSGLLKPNLLATMTVVEEQIEDVITIPVNLVQEEVGGRKYVYTLQEKDDQKRAKKQYVVTGPSQDQTVIIEDGLLADDVILTTGSRSATDGVLLKLTR